jgi:hypothetical protein
MANDKPKRPLTKKEWAIKERLRVERVRDFYRPRKSVTLPRFSWDGDKDDRVQEQKNNG